MPNRLNLGQEVEVDVKGAIKEFSDTFNDEYANHLAQHRIKATVAGIVEMMNMGAAIGRVPASVTDALGDEIEATFRFLGASDNCISCVRYELNTLVEAASFALEIA